MPMKLDIDAKYEVTQSDVTLTIIIGNAQLGISRVKLDDLELARGEIDNLLIGKGPAIAGKAIYGKSVVTDVNDKTNRVNVCYIINGGKVDMEYHSETMVAEEGDSKIFRAKFELKN